MSYKIVVDSCGELPEKLKASGRFQNVSLEIFVDDYRIVDDENFDQADFLRRMAQSPNCPKSTCPSPEQYVQTYDSEAEHIYVEEKGVKDIHVFDSKSASIGQTLIAMKVREYEEAGLAFEDVVAKTDLFIQDMNTSFVLESLEALRKNGRLSNIKAFVASALNIKPVMGATPEGTICQLGQARGMARAIDKMITDLVEKTKNPQEKIFAISHCNAAKRAQAAAKKVREIGKFKEVFVIDTAGISSLYASDGGIIMAV